MKHKLIQLGDLILKLSWFVLALNGFFGALFSLWYLKESVIAALICFVFSGMFTFFAYMMSHKIWGSWSPFHKSKVEGGNSVSRDGLRVEEQHNEQELINVDSPVMNSSETPSQSPLNDLIQVLVESFDWQELAEEFTVVDVETANSNRSSICEIAIITWKNKDIINEWYSLVNPQEDFASANIAIHGITAETVKDAPTYLEISNQVSDLLAGKVVFAHSDFDKTSLKQVVDKYKLPKLVCNWLDSLRLARRVWPERENYRLENLCQMLGYKYKAHSALEDAKACLFLLQAMHESKKINLNDNISQVKSATPNIMPLVDKVSKSSNQALKGQTIVFTGALTISRPEAKLLAEAAGGAVRTGVSGKTTMLVVGEQDLSVLRGEDKSSKHRKAESLIEKGVNIEIISEPDFMLLLGIAD